MVETTPWFVRRPGLLAVELSELRAAYPEFAPCSMTETIGRIVFHGEIVVRSHKGHRKQQLILIYGDDYDYSPPTVIPLDAAEMTEPHEASAISAISWFSFRHQMADGSLCLFQRDSSAVRITGVDALRRAERWLHEFETERLSPELDTVGAELEEHYRRHGLVIAGPAILNGATAARGKLAAVQLGDEDHLRYVITHAESDGHALTENDTLARFLQMWSGEDCTAIWGADLARISELARESPLRFWSGEYVKLEREPPIVRSVETLAAILYPHDADPVATLASNYSHSIAADSGLILALRYPSRSDGDEWLFLRLHLRPKAVERVEAPGMPGVSAIIIDTTSTRDDLLRRGEIGVLPLEDFRRSALTVRNTGRVPYDVAKLSVAMFGAGALGSVAADLLGKCGLGKVALCDPQILRAGNALRHIGGLHQIGENKVDIVARSILTHNAHCETPVLSGSALTLKSEVLRETTCIVSTIANDSTELAVNERVIDAGATAYFLRAQRAGNVGRLFRVRRGSDACFECVLRHYDAEFRYLVVPPEEGATVAHECGSPVLAASAADLAAIAAIGVRRILDDMTSPGPTNHWLWTISGTQNVGGLDKPLAEVRATLSPHSDCQTCAPSPVVRIVLEDGARESMVAMVRASFPSETGGILIGHFRGDVVHVVAVSDSGPAASESPDGFIRDGQHCQAFLERWIRESHGALTYVGEWHSHPKHRAFPSYTDVASLASISADPNFNTPAPVMLIVGLETPDGTPVTNGSVYPARGRGFIVPVT